MAINGAKTATTMRIRAITAPKAPRGFLRAKRRRCCQMAPCQMAPLHDRPYCFAHDPERAADAAEARRLGGARRRKEGTIAIAYDLPGLDSVEGIRRVFEIARTDVLGLDNTINRARALIAVGSAAIKLLGADYEERLKALEEVVLRRRQADDDESDI